MWTQVIFWIGINLAIVYGVRFEFSPEDTPCIIMDLEATFNLSKLSPEYENVVFKLDGGIVSNRSCICDNTTFTNVLTVNTFPENERLQFKFPFEGTNVFMSVVYTVKTALHLSDNTSQEIEFESNGQIQIGTRPYSYQCSKEMFIFSEDKPYYMTMDIRNLHVQAYDVNGDFSTVIRCAEDPTTPVTTPMEPTETTEPAETTTPSKPTTESTPTTNKPTTKRPELETTVTTEPTSAEPEPMTTETPTLEPTTQEPTSQEPTTPEPTTEPPATTPTGPFAPKFVLKDVNNSYYCVVLQGDIVFRITYNQTNKTETVFAEVQIPSNATVSGSCSYMGANNSQQIILTFYKTWTFEVIIGQETTEERFMGRRLLANTEGYAWQEVTLTYTLDEHFDDPSDAESSKTAKNKLTFDTLKADPQGYKCSSDDSVDIDQEVQIELANFQYRAFGDTDEDNLPTEGFTECEKDHQKKDDDDDDVGVIVGAVVGGLAAVVILIGIVLYIRKRKKYDYEVM